MYTHTHRTIEINQEIRKIKTIRWATTIVIETIIVIATQEQQMPDEVVEPQFK